MTKLKRLKFSIRYWRISVTLWSGMAAFNCICTAQSAKYEVRDADTGKIVLPYLSCRLEDEKNQKLLSTE